MKRIRFIFEFLAGGTELQRGGPKMPPPVATGLAEQLNIDAVTVACKWIDGCSLALYSATVSVVSVGICHRNKVNSIAQPKDSILYITLHYIF